MTLQIYLKVTLNYACKYIINTLLYWYYTDTNYQVPLFNKIKEVYYMQMS